MGQTILFIGDSITDCGRGGDPLGLGSGYVDVVAARLRDRGDDATVLNTGISGNRIAHLQERWQADALDHAPSVLSIYIGVNDTLVAFFEGQATPAELFEERYTDVLERAVVAGVPRIMLVEPFFIDTDQAAAPWQRGNAFARADLDAKRPIVRALADRFGATFVPLQAVIDAAAVERSRGVVAPDGVHPSTFGHRLIAGRWLDAYDAPTAPGS